MTTRSAQPGCSGVADPSDSREQADASLGRLDPRHAMPKARVAGDRCSRCAIGIPTAAVPGAQGRRAPTGVVGRPERASTRSSRAWTPHGEAAALLVDSRLARRTIPITSRAASRARRRNVTRHTVRRPAWPHADAHGGASGGRDPAVREALEALGLDGPARRGHTASSWRYRVATSSDYGEAMAIVERIERGPDDHGSSGRSAWRHGGQVGRKLPFIPAQSVRRGMVMFTEDGDYDVVEASERDPPRPARLRPQRRAHAQLHRRRI